MSKNKRILTDEHYQKSSDWLEWASEEMQDPIIQSDELEKLEKLFLYTSKLMADYQMAIDCRESPTVQIAYIKENRVTMDWLKAYWAEMDKADPVGKKGKTIG